MTDLDDLGTIKKIDKSNALGIVSEEYRQLEHVFDFKLPLVVAPKHIVLAGMGGSALSALVLKSWLNDELAVPLEIVRDYDIPGYVGHETLFIASSYSGNTEETVAALTQAEKRKARIVVMAAGGKLADTAHERSYPLLELPDGLQPRYTTFYGLKALTTLYSELGLIGRTHLDELATATSLLEESGSSLTADIETSSNQAKQIASQLLNRTPIIYGGPLMKAAAYKWKISCNENAKVPAFWDEFSEFDHNEFMGWSSRPAGDSFAVVELQSSLENPQIQQRYGASNKLLDEHMPDPTQIEAQGQSRIAQLLWAIQLGDFVSIYLALLGKVDPTPVKLMEELKKELSKS